MAECISKLELVWRIRKRNDEEPRRDYLDFVVDGKSLRDILDQDQRIGCFGWLPPDCEKVFLDELLLEKFPSMAYGRGNRVLLYVCAECGDIDCGAITIQVEKTNDMIIWKDFSQIYLNDLMLYEHDFEKFENIGPYCFNEKEYRQVLVERPATRWREED